MTHKLPAVSVLLPVYNAERYLNAAVESVLKQTFGDFELLALDDGSTDSSLAILQDLAKQDSRLLVKTRENRGLVATLNEMIEMSRGRYLARMDSDDICRPERFAKQTQFLESNPDHVAVGSRVLFIDPDGMPLMEFVDKFVHDEIDHLHLNGGHTHIPHPSVMMRKDAVVRVGGYGSEYRYAQDVDLYLRLAEIGKLANIPEVLLEYRFNLESISFKNRTEQTSLARKAAMAAWTRRGLGPVPEMSAEPIRVETPEDLHRKWAWWALSQGYVSTARKHAVRAFRLGPARRQNIATLVRAIRGR